ncbi:MAG: hypothetical protein ACRC2S_28805 [Waterburya sp.]
MLLHLNVKLIEVKQISDRFINITNKLSEEIKTPEKQTNQRLQQLLNEIGEYFNSLNTDLVLVQRRFKLNAVGYGIILDRRRDYS